MPAMVWLGTKKRRPCFDFSLLVAVLSLVLFVSKLDYEYSIPRFRGKLPLLQKVEELCQLHNSDDQWV
jgi:hypothetical protein